MGYEKSERKNTAIGGVLRASGEMLLHQAFPFREM
jgi:hypothetical protein